MATTTINTGLNWAHEPATHTHKTPLYNKFIAFADSQAEHKTLWFLLSMIVQGVFFLPVPAVLIYFYNAPITVLIITLSAFFANIILGMGGASVRTLLLIFAASALIHLAMAAIFII